MRLNTFLLLFGLFASAIVLRRLFRLKSKKTVNRVNRYRPSRFSSMAEFDIAAMGAEPPLNGAKEKYDFYFAALTRASLGSEDQARRLIQFEQDRGTRAGLEITKVMASKLAFERLRDRSP